MYRNKKNFKPKKKKMQSNNKRNDKNSFLEKTSKDSK